MKPHHESTLTLPPAAPTAPITAASLRRLKWNEVAAIGDFTANGLKGFELWDGPTGFQAGSFVRPIYRRHDQPSPKTV